jgi:integrase
MRWRIDWCIRKPGTTSRETHCGSADSLLDVSSPPTGRAVKTTENSCRIYVWQDTGLVFTTTYGTPYEPRNFARHFALRCKKAGVRYIRVHDTRRTCGSLLAALDVHPRVAMQILRHSKIAITMEIYTEVPDARTRDALRRLGDQLDG